MLKIQKLETRPAFSPVARNAKVGNVWINVARPKHRRAVAERLAQLARIDHPDHIVRVR